MARYCDACGAPVGDDDLFCISCGARLSPVMQTPATHDSAVAATLSETRDLTSPALPVMEQARSLEGLYGAVCVDDDADSTTMVYDDSVDETNADAPTFVFDSEPVFMLVRKATGEELVLKDGDVVGKGTKASVRVSGNHGISRRHLRFSVGDDGCCLVEDLGSTNGTFLADERLGVREPCEIADGTVIRIADEAFEFQVR